MNCIAKMFPNNKALNVPLAINIIVDTHHDKPCLQLRTRIKDLNQIKAIISCAYHETPILIVPRFIDKLRGINSLIEKGLVYREGNNYYFVF